MSRVIRDRAEGLQYHALPTDDPLRALNILGEAAGLQPLSDEHDDQGSETPEGRPLLSTLGIHRAQILIVVLVTGYGVAATIATLRMPETKGTNLKA